MKKLILLSSLLLLIFTANSFTVSKPKLINHKVYSVENIGYFTVGGIEYHANGDSQTHLVTELYRTDGAHNFVEYVSFNPFSYWNDDFGSNHNQRGININFYYNDQNLSYVGPVILEE